MRVAILSGRRAANTGPEGSKLADTEEDCGSRSGLTPPVRGSSRLDNNNKRRHSSTKQASDQTPVPQQGFFLRLYSLGRFAGVTEPEIKQGSRGAALRGRDLWPAGGEPAAVAHDLLTRPHPHLESPQFRHVMQPSIITTAAVLHLAQSWAPSGKWDLEKASVCLVRASNSARFSSTSFCWCSSSSGFRKRPMVCRCRSMT